MSLAGRRNASCQAQQSARAVPETCFESISAQNSPKRGPRGVLFTSKPSVGSPNAGKSAQNFCGTSVTLLRTKRNQFAQPEGRRGVSKGDVYRCARPCAPGPGTALGGPLLGCARARGCCARARNSPAPSRSQEGGRPAPFLGLVHMDARSGTHLPWTPRDAPQAEQTGSFLSSAVLRRCRRNFGHFSPRLGSRPRVLR